jgi:uncharacterized protein YprB with RNaseH-like and TPR domain
MIFRDFLREAYLSIETTGLSPQDGQITVIGLYLTNNHRGMIVAIGR